MSVAPNSVNSAENSVCKCKKNSKKISELAPQKSTRAKPQRTTDCDPRSLAISDCNRSQGLRSFDRENSCRKSNFGGSDGHSIAVADFSWLSDR